MKITLLLMLLTVCNVLYGQRTVEERQKALQEIAERTKIQDLERKERVKKYLKSDEEPRFETIELADGTKITQLLYDIDDNGLPIYLATDNVDAAVTTGADFLADKNGLGFGLTGDGVKVGVWDGGLVRTSHVEFVNGNITPSDGSTSLNFHANHVLGTIMAQGVNSRARGMAPGVEMYAFDNVSWENEVPGYLDPEDGGLLLSNHSYGKFAGWGRDGRWYGDASISDREDWKFGFYGEEARLIDELAFNSPYYLMCWSAGNQRGESSDDNTYPADGPYDIVGPEKTGKNSLAVGAVRKISSGYETSSDVVMSTFSSWGPLDDGRIKPDLVGAGVGVFSTLEQFDSHYGSLNGTSMSTPNVVGTLALLQELHKKTTGKFLKSATLKGLAIHTAQEAGVGPGPDYQFGWGLMNGKGAAELILKQNGFNQRIENVVLADGDTFTFEILPKAGSDVKVTICWTDVPGTPVSAQLDPGDLMLVNDLDMRITNNSEEHFPFILDPSIPALAATRGDNFRDNMEKIEFQASANEPYTVTISHKGQLENQMQEFALIVSYESDERQTFYRIGTGIQWDNPENWSLSSGGEPTSQVPGAADVVVFDNNTFEQMADQAEESEPVFVLNQDIEVRSLIAASSNSAVINLNGHSLTTYSSLSASVGQVQFVGEGSIILKDSQSSTNYITGSPASFENVDLIIDYEFGSTALIDQNFSMRSVTVQNGTLLINESKPTFGSLIVNNESTLILTDAEVTFTSAIKTSVNSTITAQGTTLIFDGESSMDVDSNFPTVSLQVIDGTLTTSTDLTLNDLILKLGTGINQKEGTTISVSGQMEALGRAEDRVHLNSSAGKAAIFMEKEALYCFDFLDVEGVDISGVGAFNVGLNGSVQNAVGWQMKACEDVLFADFTISSQICQGSVTSATDVSNGNITAWKWYLDGELVSELVSPLFDFPELDTYEIMLEVTDEANEIDSFTRQISTVENTIEENQIINSNGQLVSRKPADTYQWYFNDMAIEGATERTYQLTGEAGVYFVVTGDGECFRKSEEVPFAVTSTDEDPQLTASYNVYPNPAQNELTIAVESLQRGELVLELTDMSGRTLYSNSYTKNQFAFEQTIDTSELPNGLYVINVIQGGEKETKLVAIEK